MSQPKQGRGAPLTLDLRFQEAPPSFNSTTRGGVRQPGLLRMHYRHRKFLMERWEWLVKEALQQAGAQQKYAEAVDRLPFTRCTVEHTYLHQTGHPMDLDNVAGQLKVLLDALRHTGVLLDDAPRCVVSIRVRQEVQLPLTPPGCVVQIVGWLAEPPRVGPWTQAGLPEAP